MNPGSFFTKTGVPVLLDCMVSLPTRVVAGVMSTTTATASLLVGTGSPDSAPLGTLTEAVWVKVLPPDTLSTVPVTVMADACPPTATAAPLHSQLMRFPLAAPQDQPAPLAEGLP